MRPKYYYFKLDTAPMRVYVDSGEVELLHLGSGKWVSWQFAKTMMEKK